MSYFESLNLPEPSSCALADTFEEARELFKKCLKAYNEALSFYVLDGFVTEHITVLQEISLLYRMIALFEPDLSRRW